MNVITLRPTPSSSGYDLPLLILTHNFISPDIIPIWVIFWKLGNTFTIKIGNGVDLKVERLVVVYFR